jgi:hypothetical protein
MKKSELSRLKEMLSKSNEIKYMKKVRTERKKVL